jgi:ABC-type enterochelin transport system ATPase subunit
VKDRRKSEPPAGLAKLSQVLDQRPVLVALAGPNGAGKSTFFHAHLKPAALRFLNADDIARELEIDAYEAAKVITQLRQELVKRRAPVKREISASDGQGSLSSACRCVALDAAS